MNTVAECPDDPAFEAWADAEAAYESFIAHLRLKGTLNEP
jgi:hypothetical protein